MPARVRSSGSSPPRRCSAGPRCARSIASWSWSRSKASRPPAERERRCVVAGSRHDDVVPERGVVAHRASGDLCVRDHRREVVRRGCGDGLAVISSKIASMSGRDSTKSWWVRELVDVLGVPGAEDALRQLQHRRLVLLRHAEDAHDDPEREGDGDVLGKVARAAEITELGPTYSSAIRSIASGRPETAEGRKYGVGDIAVAAVLLAIHVDERRSLDARVERGAARRTPG